MLFNLRTSPTQVGAITGRDLAHRQRSASQRAAIAAALVAGEVVLSHPTLKQAARLAHASVPYTRAALRASPAARARLGSGGRTIQSL
jgi:hypothetical protein